MQEQSPLSAARIEQARGLIDPVFLNMPLVSDPGLDRDLGIRIHLKIELDNPIRSFKGRGTGFFVATGLPAGVPVVAASAGNFGQGLAYNARKRGHAVTVFAARGANTTKIDAMRRFGAEVIVDGADFDEAKALAQAHAERLGQVFVEDGAVASIAEGAGTIAAEVTDALAGIDAFIVPLGNGALATGVGCWLKAASPKTKVIAVVAEGAACMALSWREGPCRNDGAGRHDRRRHRRPRPRPVRARLHEDDDRRRSCRVGQRSDCGHVAYRRPPRTAHRTGGRGWLRWPTSPP